MMMAATSEFVPFPILDSVTYLDKPEEDDDGSSSSKRGNDPEIIQITKPGRPPRILAPIRHCESSAQLGRISPQSVGVVVDTGFVPVIRSGSWEDPGPKGYMEDRHVCVNNLSVAGFDLSGAFYGVFDGHGGSDAACFVRENLLNFIVEDLCFPDHAEDAMRDAFLRADYEFEEAAGTLDSSSGTTAITALILGRKMLIANAGDCRAVLGKRGKAVDLSIDHKADSKRERDRIRKVGGKVLDGYLNCLNGQLEVSRSIGDWHMKGPRGSLSPLIADPELREMTIEEEDEFLIIACDGLWDVMSSQGAVTIVRRELIEHNDPKRCSQALVQEALSRNTGDNLTAVVICFSANPPPQLEKAPLRMRRSISAEGFNFLKGALDGLV